MKLLGGIQLDNGGMARSVDTMYLQQNIMDITNQNMVGFNKVGYQKDVPYVTSFAEYIGCYALSSKRDDEIGRIKITKMPLDTALATKGYFRVQTPDGVQLSRDGRFRIDKDGNLINIQNQKILSTSGKPVKFNNIPKDLQNIKIYDNGDIKIFDPDKLKFQDVGTISIVDANKQPVKDSMLKQGYIEESNVNLQEEAYKLITVRRNFEANRQLFIIQNEALSKLLQELGKA